MKRDFQDRSMQLLIIGVICIFYIVGIVGHGIEATFPIMITLTPWVLLIFGGLVFLIEAREAGRKLLLWALGTYIVTLAAEIVGVKTGLVFGEYVYGETLGLSVLGVPLVIGFNWMVIVLGLSAFTTHLIARKAVAVFVTALLAVVFDFVMEPVAIALDYWTWTGGDIPLQNYIAWFVIALIASAVYSYTGISRKTWIPSAYVGVQLVFFLSIRFFA